MKISEIKNLDELRMAIDQTDQKIEFQKKSIKLQYSNFKQQVMPSNMLRSFCSSFGNQITIKLLNLASKIL
ncbi:MAG: hypothetical protein MJZ33_09360 [Paludibacteraceae bacterium]|nr:hypothetical protein [Paludibacteraceae bacterium]